MGSEKTWSSGWHTGSAECVNWYIIIRERLILEKPEKKEPEVKGAVAELLRSLFLLESLITPVPTTPKRARREPCLTSVVLIRHLRQGSGRGEQALLSSLCLALLHSDLQAEGNEASQTPSLHCSPVSKHYTGSRFFWTKLKLKPAFEEGSFWRMVSGPQTWSLGRWGQGLLRVPLSLKLSGFS